MFREQIISTDERLCALIPYRLKNGSCSFTIFPIRTYCLLVTTESTPNDVGDQCMLSEQLDDDDDFLCLQKLIPSSSRGLFVFQDSSVSSFCFLTSIEKSDRNREVGRKLDKS